MNFNSLNRFNEKVEQFVKAFQENTDDKIDENGGRQRDPWKTIIPGYFANPFVSISLTFYHAGKTLERAAKVVYNVALTVFSGLAVLFTFGQIPKLNRFAVEKLFLSGLNITALTFSIGFTVANFLVGIQGLVSPKAAIKNEVYLVHHQNRMDKDIEDLRNIYFKPDEKGNTQSETTNIPKLIVGHMLHGIMSALFPKF